MLSVETTRKGLLSKDYDVRWDGRSVATWSGRGVRRRQELTVEGRPYLLTAERGISRFALEGEYAARCERAADGLLSGRHWRLTAGAAEYRLAGHGRRFVLTDGSGERGAVWRGGRSPVRYGAELPDELPVPVQVFLVWVAMSIWQTRSRRRRAAAASSAASG